MLEGASEVFEKAMAGEAPEVDAETVRYLQAKIGELAVTNVFCRERSNPGAGMVGTGHPRLSIAVQFRLMSIPRSTYYHRPAGETIEKLGLVQAIDRRFMEMSFYGVRQMTWHLRSEPHAGNPKRV